jgi:hypothetical protein
MGAGFFYAIVQSLPDVMTERVDWRVVGNKDSNVTINFKRNGFA